MNIRPMRIDDCAAVAAMVARLAAEKNPDVVPALDVGHLRENAFGGGALIDVTVVEDDDGALAGACLGLMTFSTWRGAKGLYVVDLFVDRVRRGDGIGLALLTEAARRARAKGARFVKLEVDRLNVDAARFYERLGFVRHEADRLFILETGDLDRLAGAPIKSP